MLLLDALAERYGCLPSEVLARGDTFDLTCFDVAVTYRQYQANKQNRAPSTDMYKQEDLQNIFDSVREKKTQ